jgi:hypothetical protein
MGLQATRLSTTAMMPSRHARHLSLLSRTEAEDGVVALSMATTFPRIDPHAADQALGIAGAGTNRSLLMY